MDPLSLLPEEMWELVLLQVANSDDPDDVLNAFYAYPDLTSLVCQKIVLTCLITVLFPKYLSFKDVLNFRLVSKRCRVAVDKILANHSDRQPYQEMRAERSNRMTLKTPFNYQMLPSFKTRAEVVKSAKTRNEIMRLPQQTNPFLWNSLSVHVGSELRNGPTSVDDLTQMLPFLEKFGRHVHYAEFKFSHPGRIQHEHLVVVRLLNCLQHMPSLKVLKMKGSMGYDLGCQNHLPSLVPFLGPYNAPSTIRIPAQLETLDLSNLDILAPVVSHKLVTSLISHEHLQKLVINLSDWDDRFAPLCQHVRELNFKMRWYYSESGSGNIARLQQILPQLGDRRNLLKIAIPGNTIKFSQVLDFLRQYPMQAIEVTATEKSQLIGMNHDKPDFIIPSLRQMILDDHVGFTTHFLRALPYLEYFGIRMGYSNIPRFSCRKSAFVRSLMEHNAPVPMVPVYIRHYFSDDISRFGTWEHSIWDVAPNLKMFTVLDHTGKVCRRYVRECQNKVFKC